MADEKKSKSQGAKARNTWPLTVGNYSTISIFLLRWTDGFGGTGGAMSILKRRT